MPRPVKRSPQTPPCPNGCPPSSTSRECHRRIWKERGRCICECHDGNVPTEEDGS